MKWFKRNPPEPQIRRLPVEPASTYFRRGSLGDFYAPPHDFWTALARLEVRIEKLERA